MIQPDSLDDLPMMKHHTTPGNDRRNSLTDYNDLGVTARHERLEVPQGSEAEQ